MKSKVPENETATEVTGVRLTPTEASQLNSISKDTGVAKAKLVHIAVRRLLREWNADGKITLEKQ